MGKFRRAQITLLAVGALIASAALFVLLYLEPESGSVRFPEQSIVVFDRNGKIQSAYLSSDDEWNIPVSLDKMGRWTAEVAVAIEDKRFYRHNGIDFIAITRALFDNLRSGRIVSGASTITSQVIRLSKPRPRTFATKLLEFWGARRLESKISKSEILELYLNNATFGGNIRGVEAASRAYFNKSANELSLGESVLLVSILRAPSRLRPDRYPIEAKKARDSRLTFLLGKNIISLENMRFAIDEPIRSHRYQIAKTASMASRHAIKNSGNQRQIRSTIDSRYQTILERRLAVSLSNLPDSITAAGVVVENSSGEVLAYVGNARHGMPTEGAQVDCGDAPRSPGSTLKPFVYAKAFERGLLTPMSILADTPVAFRGSPPRNFDRFHRGPVTARDALSFSLNTPAVRVLRMLGYAQVLSLFDRLGFAYIQKDSARYADSLILGGCEVTLLELANAYRTLASDGVSSPLKWAINASASSKDVISRSSAWITSNILQDERKFLPLYQQIFKEKNQIVAFKTGTSHGFRDAWTAGFTNRLTVVVWFGIPDGKSDNNLVGLQTAAPAVLNVIRELWRPGDEVQKKQPEEVYARNVCSVSGMPPGKYCPSVLVDYAIKDISPIEPCDVHRNVDGNIVVQYPPEIGGWTQMRERANYQNFGVKIVRPSRNRSIVKQPESPSARTFFSAEGPAPHYWYIDGRYAATDTDGSGLFIDIALGRHRASVLSGGESDSVEFQVIDSKTTSWPTERILN